MAKEKAKPYESWEETDQALRRICELDISRTKLEGELTLRINELKEEFQIKAEGISAERDGIEKRIAAFAQEHKEDFLKTRNKELNFGTIAYRVTKKLVINNIKACLAALKALGMSQYLIVTEKPDKEALKELDNQTLAKLGARVNFEDKLRIEPNLERIQPVTTADC